MSGFLSRLFGGGKKTSPGAAEVEKLIKVTLEGMLSRGSFNLKFNLTHTVENDEPVVIVNFQGDDEELLKEREGQLIDAFQLFLKRVVQHHIPEDKTNVVVDCNGYREESSQALVDLAEKLL
jgi:spoIIIJ-associated protein